MKQVKLVAIEKLEEQEVPVPQINPDQVLVRVEACGICGSDVHSYLGHHPFVDPPIVLGHEFSGIVEKTGNRVTDIKVGERVTSEIVVNCGECYTCTHGKYQICDKGKYLGNVGIDGAMAEYVALNADKVHTLPGVMDPCEGAMVEPSAVGMHAVRMSNFKVGDIALVIGAGIIGNLTAQVLKIAGARKVILTDVLPARVEKAKEMGFEHVLNTAQINLKEWIADEVQKDNLDVVFDCVGSEQSINTAINNARKGSQIVLIGVPPRDLSVNLAFVQDREIVLLGSCQYVRDDYIRTIDFIAEKVLKVNSLITHHLSFADYQKAFDIAVDREEVKKGSMKVMMKYDG